MRHMQWMMKGGVAALLVCGELMLGAGVSAEAPQTVEIHAKKFAYSPAEITLHKGETYKLHLISDDVPHSLRIKSLALNGAMKANVYTDVLFTPQQVGDFKADCGLYCGAGHKAMALMVHVVDK